jgi:hypothetical protein
MPPLQLEPESGPCFHPPTHPHLNPLTHTHTHTHTLILGGTNTSLPELEPIPNTNPKP